MSDNSNSLSEEPEPAFVLCRRCGYTRIFFMPGHSLPFQYKDKQIHYCEVGKSFPCIYCEAIIYLDRRVLDSNGRRLPLDYDTGKYHLCSKQKRAEG